MANNKRKSTLRELVTRRARGRCEYCQSPREYAHQSFSLEHIEPRSKKGKTSLDNLALACQGCNNHKFTQTEGQDPESEDWVALFHPRKHRWSDHFAWSEDLLGVLGITPIGRATVVVLHLNRKPLVNLRRLLVIAGKHPQQE
jgi:hypothetical protein